MIAYDRLEYSSTLRQTFHGMLQHHPIVSFAYCRFVFFRWFHQMLNRIDLELGRALIGTPLEHTADQQAGNNVTESFENDLFQVRNTETWESDLRHMLPRLEVCQVEANEPLAPSQIAAPPLGKD